MDPDPAIFVIDFQDANKKLFFSAHFFLKVEGSGFVPLTNGSGSGCRRPKNIGIRRIRIRNTGCILHRVPADTISLTKNGFEYNIGQKGEEGNRKYSKAGVGLKQKIPYSFYFFAACYDLKYNQKTQ